MRSWLRLASQSGESIGTIVPRLNDNFSSEADSNKYLLCDGSNFSASEYPKLAALIGTTLPDLRNRFLEGAGTLAESNKFIEAGLPSITSSLTFNIRASKNDINADWGVNGNRVMTNGGASTTAVPASKIGVSFSSNEIFGKSETVQPNAWTVRYYIRAK